MTDLPTLANRLVDSVMVLVERAQRFSLKIGLVAAAVAVPSFLLGLAALDGGIRTVWIALAIGFGVIGIGGALLAWWRLRALRHNTTALVADVQSLLSRDQGVRSTVIETFETNDAEGASVMVWSRQFGSMRSAMGDRVSTYRQLPAAITAVTSFPALVGGAVLITLVFAGCALVFLLALAI